MSRTHLSQLRVCGAFLVDDVSILKSHLSSEKRNKNCLKSRLIFPVLKVQKYTNSVILCNFWLSNKIIYNLTNIMNMHIRSIFKKIVVFHALIIVIDAEVIKEQFFPEHCLFKKVIKRATSLLFRIDMYYCIFFTCIIL